MIGRQILHYKILEKLGEGGMGIVYLAEDTKLKRQVAIKFLPPHIAKNSDERKRFEIEAQAAAALNHPNIATIHAIEYSDDDVFIVMEYIEGKELKQIIEEAKGQRADDKSLTANSLVSVDYCMDIATQIASGLQAAHKKGIIHRDIKSANIMITGEGQVKIMDFGLAKLGAGIFLTKEHSTLGTAPYMSPEQINGDEVDQRSDIWSLGVVLYELLSGRLPFRGDYEQAVIYSILNENPDPVLTWREDIPDALVQVVDTCLQKDPAHRFQKAQDVVAVLRGSQQASEVADGSRIKASPVAGKQKRAVLRWIFAGIGIMGILVYFLWISQAQESKSERTMLAVLPFENLGSADEDYFTDGMTEEIISRLSTIKSLGIISRKSVQLYRETDKSLKEIGSELGVDFVLEGTVRWAKGTDGKERVRITPQLIRVRDDIHLWSDVYERVINDVFEVQSDIAHNVVSELGINLLEPERNNINNIPTANIEAYHLFLKGRYLLGRPHFTVEYWKEAISYFNHAVELDPGFSLAYSELSRAHAGLYFFRDDLSPERLAMAKNAADKAGQAGQITPAIHLNLGYFYLYAYHDLDKALQEFNQAEAGMPNSVDVLRAKSDLYETRGDWRQLIMVDERAAELSPRDPSVLTDLIFAYWFNRDYEKGLELCDRTVALAPEEIWPYLYIAHIQQSFTGPNERSRAALKNVPETHSFWWFAWYWQEVGERRFENAFAVLEKTKGDWVTNKVFARPKSLMRAFIYDYLGQKEQAGAAYDSARVLLEQELTRHGDDPRYHSSLGLAFAGMGLKDQAIRAGQKAMELLPVQKDAVYGTMFVLDFAAICTMSGEYDRALEQVEYLLSIPSPMSEGWLKMDIRFAPLLKLPECQALLKKNAEKN